MSRVQRKVNRVNGFAKQTGKHKVWAVHRGSPVPADSQSFGDRVAVVWRC